MKYAPIEKTVAKEAISVMAEATVQLISLKQERQELYNKIIGRINNISFRFHGYVGKCPQTIKGLNNEEIAFLNECKDILIKSANINP